MRPTYRSCLVIPGQHKALCGDRLGVFYWVKDYYATPSVVGSLCPKCKEIAEDPIVRLSVLDI